MDEIQPKSPSKTISPELAKKLAALPEDRRKKLMALASQQLSLEEIERRMQQQDE